MLAVVAAVAAASGVAALGRSTKVTASAEPPQPATLPRTPTSYLGIYAPPAPRSYSGVRHFAAATGVSPDVVLYYSGWNEPFQAAFAAAATRHHAVPLVQIDPTRISLAAIADGRYDAYLRSYAAQVRAFRDRVILSFGHEMNGDWYTWGWKHTSPRVFVAAWRHVVRVFRAAGAQNVSWLWTINVALSGIAAPPAPWWPGSSYVTWVGIDGYYRTPAVSFAALFGPTIKLVRTLTVDPVLISETAAAPDTDMPAKIAGLFAGVRAYGLLGFVWFNAHKLQDWRLDSPAAIAAYRRGARSFAHPAS